MTSDPEIEAATAEVPLSNDAAYGPGDSAAATAAAQHVGGAALLPHQRGADLLRRRDPVQPARAGPLGPQLHLHHLLRRLGRRPPAGVHPEAQAVHRVRVGRGDQQLAALQPGGAGLHRQPPAAGCAAQDRDGVLRRRDRADLRRARLRPDPAVGGAAGAPGLEAGHHPARQRRRRAERAQHPHHRGGLRGPGPAVHRGRTGHRPGGADRVRRLRQDHLLHRRRGRLEEERQGHRRPGGQGDEADQQPPHRRGGGADPQRHHRRAVHDRADRAPGADPVPGRLVRQRDVPRRPRRRPPTACRRPGPPAGRPARRRRATAASSRSTCWSTSTTTSATWAS